MNNHDAWSFGTASKLVVVDQTTGCTERIRDFPKAKARQSRNRSGARTVPGRSKPATTKMPETLDAPVSAWPLRTGTVRAPGKSSQRATLLGDSTAKSAPRRTGASAQTATKSPASRRVLIADDDALVRGSLAAVLECQGYVVDEAKDGYQAIARAKARKPDLVLLDLNMPNLDGWAAFMQLDRTEPLLPVIIITARPNQYLNAVELGADAFMEKPLNIRLLLEAVAWLLNEDPDQHFRRITSRNFVTRLLSRPTH